MSDRNYSRCPACGKYPCKCKEERMAENEVRPLCQLCGKPMPEGEEMFTFHGYSGPCPAPGPVYTPPAGPLQFGIRQPSAVPAAEGPLKKVLGEDTWADEALQCKTKAQMVTLLRAFAANMKAHREAAGKGRNNDAATQVDACASGAGWADTGLRRDAANVAAGEGQDYEKEAHAIWQCLDDQYFYVCGENGQVASRLSVETVLANHLRQRDLSHSRPDLEKRLEQWRNRARLFRDAYEDKACEVTALTIQKLDLESLGDEAMRIQRDRARESSKRMIKLATRNLKDRADSYSRLLGELAEKADMQLDGHFFKPDEEGETCLRCGNNVRDKHHYSDGNDEQKTRAALREKLEEVKKVNPPNKENV